MKRLLAIVIAIVFAFGIHQVQAAKPSVIELKAGQSLPNIGKNKAMVIDFNAAWCGPCRTFAPTFARAATKFAKKAVFVSVNVDNNPELAQSFSVRSIPYVVVIRPGKDPVRHIGVMSYEEFTDFLKAALK